MKKNINSLLFVLLSAVSFQLSVYADTDIAVVEKPFLEGRYDRAEYEAKRLIDERARQRDEVYYLKGLSELKLGKFNQARESFQVIISKYRKSNRVFDAYAGIGDSYLLEGNIEAAMKTYNEIKEKFPSDKNITLIDSRLSECRKKAGTVPVAPAPSPITENKVEAPQAEKIVPAGVVQDETPKVNISVQVGCFKNKRNADKLSSKLAASGYKSYVEVPVDAGDKLYRVKVGHPQSKGDAESLAAKLNREGYRTKICDDSSCQ